MAKMRESRRVHREHGRTSLGLRLHMAVREGCAMHVDPAVGRVFWLAANEGTTPGGRGVDWPSALEKLKTPSRHQTFTRLFT